MAMFMEASLAFLGLLDPTRKSLGMMISYALQYYYMDIWWHWLFPPIVCLSLLIMMVTFLAISLEKVVDPRLRESMPGRSHEPDPQGFRRCLPRRGSQHSGR